MHRELFVPVWRGSWELRLTASANMTAGRGAFMAPSFRMAEGRVSRKTALTFWRGCQSLYKLSSHFLTSLSLSLSTHTYTTHAHTHREGRREGGRRKEVLLVSSFQDSRLNCMVW